MSIVGLSGSGKTELMFHMLQGNSFYPRFEKIYYLFKEFQPLFREMRGSIARIEFIKYFRIGDNKKSFELSSYI